MPIPGVLTLASNERPDQEGIESLLDVLMHHDEWGTAAVLASYCAVVAPDLAPEAARTAGALARPGRSGTAGGVFGRHRSLCICPPAR